jgi:hypothetical protein
LADNFEYERCRMYAFRGQNYSGNTKCRRISWKSALCVLSLALLSVCSFAPAAGDGNSIDNAGRSIVFDGWYNPGKEKWQGPIHDKILFTWFTMGTAAPNEAEYKKLVSHLRQQGVKYIGDYYSATTSYSQRPLEDPLRYPEGAIPPDAIEPSWIVRDKAGMPVTWPGQKDRFFLDVGMKEVQDAILGRAIQIAKRDGADVLYLDNWYYNYGALQDMSKQQWADKCLSFLKRARKLTQESNLKLVVNQVSPVESWPEFAPYLDGIAYEMPAHPDQLKTRDLYELELSSYEKVLAMGKSIFLYTYISSRNKQWDEDGRKVAATAMLVMPEVQPYWGGIYVDLSTYEVWPVGGWAMWPEQLGKPLGPRKWDGNTVTRNFEHGSIAVTPGDPPKFNVTMNY